MLAALVVCALSAHAAAAQSLSRVSLDSVVSADVFGGDNTTGRPDTAIDISGVVRLGGGWSARVRPWFFKPSDDNAEWSKEIYEAGVQYIRPGRTSLRLDAGYIASPIGLGMLDMRADTNPTIQSHLSYYVPLLRFDRGAPSVGAISASYPLGASLTLSGGRWDARAALVNSAPTRRFALPASYGSPRATPVFVGGAGVTPIAGLRLGASLAAGRYATTSEVADTTFATSGGYAAVSQADVASLAARRLLMWTIEGEYAVAHTKVAGEFTQERFEHGTTDRSETWFVQAMQTLSPRWFAAGRLESIGTPSPLPIPGDAPLWFRSSEATLGYRLTREFTLRSSVTGTRSYTASRADRRVGIQIVWSHRWW
jgi:hypothetical protein